MSTYRVRTVRVPLERPDDETWRELRAVACEAALYGNRMLSAQTAFRLRIMPTERFRAVQNEMFKHANDRLSGWVRNAMAHRCQGYWRRAAKDVMAGRERAACFSADRALAIQADPHNNGVLFTRDRDAYLLVCRVRPVKRPVAHEAVTIRVDTGRSAKRDRYLAEALAALWSGAWTPGMVTLRFDRRRRTIDALISFRMPIVAPVAAGPRRAVLGPMNDDGQLWLRVDDGPAVDFTARLTHMRSMKAHYAGIQARIRNTVGRGSGRRRTYRRLLLSRGTFGRWVEGPLHQLSRAILTACQQHGVGDLALMELSDGLLPWDQLRQQLRYKAEATGVRITEPDRGENAVVRAKAARVRKQQRKAVHAKEAVKVLEAALGASG